MLVLDESKELKKLRDAGEEITPENVGEAIEALHPWGVDVSAGIETNGTKDPEKMNAFITAVRQADRKELIP